MAYEGRHRRSDDDRQGSGRIVRAAGVAGMAATAAAVVAVGMGAGTANADGLFGHFGPKKPTTDSSSSTGSTGTNTNSVSNAATVTRTGPSLITVKPTPSPQRSIFQYVTPGQTGTGIKGICFFNC
jgi:hypothetical protein